MSTRTRAFVLVAIAVLCIALFIAVTGSGSPRSYLEENYQEVDDSTSSARAQFHSDDATDVVLADLRRETDPDDVQYGSQSSLAPSAYATPTPGTDGSATATPSPVPGSPSSAQDGDEPVFLRYGSDWMVVLASDGTGGTDIEFDDFDSAYNHYSGSGVYFFGWGSFRGGGSGTGK